VETVPQRLSQHSNSHNFVIIFEQEIISLKVNITELKGNDQS